MLIKTLATLSVAAVASAPAFAGVVHFEGFEDPLWTPGGDNWNNYNSAVTRVASGTNGITSSAGAAHATVGLHTSQSGAFTRLGGYSTSFGSGFTASLDVYLDTSWGSGTGFDYSVAASRQDNGNHLRDFIWHVGVLNGELLVNASNNTDFQFSTGAQLTGPNEGHNYTVTQSGWYTLEQEFSDVGGVLSVTFNLIDENDTTVYTVTRSDASDDIATIVGGNRYGWLTYNTIDGLAIDNTMLSTLVVPLPQPLTLAAGGLLVVAARRRR